MKKKKISLTKLQLKKEKVSNLSNIIGGDKPQTMEVICANNTLYPACAVTGCWGAQSCQATTNCDTTWF